VQAIDQASNDHQWPAITGERRPWTRWWWMGSAVTAAEITRHLRLFQAAGFGGVEISPVYGVGGAEERYIPFLSQPWIEMLSHTLREARRLDLGVDLITGTGWPLGGPWVSADDAAARSLFEFYHVAAGGCVAEPIRSRRDPRAALQTLMAFSDDGQALDLIQRVDARQRLDWIAPPGRWNVYALFQSATGQQVKRAAPGGEGNVVDHFSASALARYLVPFDQVFATLPSEEQVRCVFNDSYEVYGANWTSDLLAQFQRRRGYDLRHFLPALSGRDNPERVSRVRSDYRQTVADLLLEAFAQPWTAWAHQHGAKARNQAHGSPGNLLDLYATADVPETETFGPDWLRIAGLAPLPGVPPQQGGRADVLVGKMASSAAHVSGKRLCSSESFTWLDEHGKVPLAHMKAELDVLFVMGVNHVFFHGTPFSPVDAGWPGWMFYATTHVAPTNPCWRDLPELNAYISRCQSFLQVGQPDNDLLLYLPIFDLWAADHGAEHLLHFLTVHSEYWLDENLATFTQAARWLWDRGYGFDFISDRLLDQAIQVSGQRLHSRGGSYRALVIAGCTLMPLETVRRILDLARQGATVLIVGELPRDVPGMSNLSERRQQLSAALAAIGPLDTTEPGIASATLDEGRLLVGSDLEALLELAGIRRERAVDTGIELVRRRYDGGYLYFMANFDEQRLDRWVSLSIQAARILIFDPAAKRHGIARSRAGDDGATEVYLQLEPGESVLLRTFSHIIDGREWQYGTPSDPRYSIEGTWQVEFIAGGPTLPAPAGVERLTSWTDWPGDNQALRAFSGTARYTIMFDKPSLDADGWALELDSVCHSARVRLNGHDLGALYARPFRIVLPHALREGQNQLEIEVTNLMANRLADLDRRQAPWRKFFFVNIQYQPFDASAWDPLPSGLIGSVRLAPLSRPRE
jgi:hypothetical protein